VVIQISSLNDRRSELNYHKDPRSAFPFQSSDHSASGTTEFNSTNFFPRLFRPTDVFRAKFCSVHFMPPDYWSYRPSNALPTELQAHLNVCHTCRSLYCTNTFVSCTLTYGSFLWILYMCCYDLPLHYRDTRTYEGESITIRNVYFISIKTTVQILQLHNFSTQSPCFTMHSVHHRTICFMPSE
jgi:hypothetical protein